MKLCLRCGEPLPEQHGPGRPRLYCCAAYKPRNVQKGRDCTVEGCDNESFSRGWCRGHYDKWRRHGDPLADKSRGICSVQGCGKPHLARTYCRNHWQQWFRSQPHEREKQAQRDRLRIDRAGRTHRKRAMRFGVLYEELDKTVIFSRDGYRCQICGAKTQGVWPHPRSATLDHIVPLSLGGDHTAANVQCACARCNLEKGIAARDEQLRLVA